MPEGAQSLADLDVPDRAVTLFELLQDDAHDAPWPWTATDAHALAHDSDDEDLHVSDRTIRNYLGALTDAGVLDKEPGDHAADADRYHLR